MTTNLILCMAVVHLTISVLTMLALFIYIWGIRNVK